MICTRETAKPEVYLASTVRLLSQLDINEMLVKAPTIPPYSTYVYMYIRYIILCTRL